MLRIQLLKEKMLTARLRDRERGQLLKNKWIKQVGIKELCKSYSLTYKTLQRRLHDMKFAFFWTGQSLPLKMNNFELDITTILAVSNLFKLP